MTDDDARPFSAVQDGGQFKVQDESGRVIVVCGDKGNASNYAVLLNEAHRQGYRAGYRDARTRYRNKGGK